MECNKPLSEWSDESLRRLLFEFGRNGELNAVQAARKAEVETLLAQREAADVVV